MSADAKHAPVAPGDRAPDFVLPAITREGQVSLDDYRERSALLLGLFRGVYCPFCRRQIARLDGVGRKLSESGVATLAVVTTPVERARLYFRYRPTRLALASDTAMSLHHALGLPAFHVTEEAMQWPASISMADLQNTRVNPDGELDEAVSLPEAGKLLDRKDGFTYEKGDGEEAMATWNQLGGTLLIDEHGIVRWAVVEAMEGPASIAEGMSEAEILAAAEAILH